MILKASQRGGAARLAAHLLNTQDNEHVEVHEVSGFVADNLPDAFQEIQAIAKGTRCRQFFFSVSINPPENVKNVSVSAFENAAHRIEQKMGLEGQPRVIAFHEKEGRRHAHVVWSRIDAKTMTAINLPYFKNKLVELSKELYLEHGWNLPKGLIDKSLRNPLHFTREQWQQAKRLSQNPESIKSTLKECWAGSDSKQTFAQTLEKHGYYLARGDRRGYVAVDWRGETYSLSRWLDLKAKDLKQRLGDKTLLPSIDETKAMIDKKLVQRMTQFLEEEAKNFHDRMAPLFSRRDTIKTRHHEQRKTLADGQAQRQHHEAAKRQASFRTGLRGLWDRFNGRNRQLKKNHEIEAYQAHIRDQNEKDRLITQQLQERQQLQQAIKRLRTQQRENVQKLTQSVISNLLKDKQETIRCEFEKVQAKIKARSQTRGFDLEM